MRARILLLLVALVAGICISCEAPYAETYDVYVTPGVPRDWVDEATEEWQTFTDVRLEVHWGVALCSGDCMSITAVQDASGKCFSGAIGCTECGTRNDCAILIDASLNDADGRQTMTHEVGHALGLEHSCPTGDDRGRACPRRRPGPSVMAPVLPDASPHVTCDDVNQYYELRGQRGDVFCSDPRLAQDGPLDFVGPASP